MVSKKNLDTTSAIKEIRQILKGSLPSISLFQKYQPQADWFRRPDCVHDIHGINHETRVLILQEIISLLLVETEKVSIDQEALRWAAITHDLRRKNDNHNIKHGHRSSQWVSQNLSHLIPQNSLEKVQLINRWHSINDHKIPNLTTEITIFKDADALDRVRTNDLDPRFLRHQLSSNLLLSPAYDLFKISFRRHHFQSIPLFDSVLESAVDIGLIEK